MKRKLFKGTLFLTGICLSALLVAGVLSLWRPLVLGKQVYWNLGTGYFQVRSIVCGLAVFTREEESGTEALFDWQKRINNSQLVLVFEHSVLQPPRSVGEYGHIFNWAKLIVGSRKGRVLPNARKAEILESIRNANSEQLYETYRSILEDKP
jgi:hypothetical protein